MTWQTIAFLAVAGPAFGYAAYRMFILFRLARAHTGRGPRVRDLPQRLVETLVNVFGQKAVLKDRKAGLMHAAIFWGFLVITIGTLEQFASTLNSSWNFQFIGTAPYWIVMLGQDIFALAVLLGVLYAAYRRLVIAPPHLGLSRDANFILLFTGSLMVSIFLMHGFHILGTSPWYGSALPISQFVAKGLSIFSLEASTQSLLSAVFKWVHMLIVLGFLAYIPGSKHLHVLAAGPNTFLKPLRRESGIKSIPFEDESITQYGAAKVTDMSWKDALDYYSCTECGRCQAVCPAWNTQKPLSPKNLIIDLKYNLFRNQDAILSGKTDQVTPAIDEHVTEDVIWACTSCRACEIACPVFIGHTDKIFAIRQNLVMMESRFPAEVQTVFKNMETNATPWAFASGDRDKWSEGLNVQTVGQAGEIDVLLWVGCAGAFDDRNKKVLRAFVSVLKKAGIRFATLGNEEKCTGDPARRIGNEYLFQTLAKENIETLNRYAVKKIVTACPHCFNTLKNEYGDFGGNYEVVHHSQFIAQLISEGRVKPTKSMEETVTLHDSCYMGRWNGEYEAPRSSLEAIPSLRLVEMSANHDKSMCCGAGGGRMFMEETIGKRVNIARTEQALETNASVIASSCPFCMTMMTDGVKSKELQDKVRVMDIAEVVDQSTP